MSCNNHCVLQKLNKKTGEYDTVLKGVLEGQDYKLYCFLSGVRGYVGSYDDIAHQGLPADFAVHDEVLADGSIVENYHEDYWMGEHSFGWITLAEFCEAETPDPPSIGDRFETEKHDNGYTVRFYEFEEEMDEYAHIRSLQAGLRAFFETYSQGATYGETYRLVFGYDS